MSARDGQAPPRLPRATQLGVVEWFRRGERERVEQVLSDLEALGVKHLRTGIFWSECQQAGGIEWYAWLLPRLAQSVDVLPILCDAPPRPGAECGPATWFVPFVDEVLRRAPGSFDWLEMPADPRAFAVHERGALCEHLVEASHRARRAGRKVALGSVRADDAAWLAQLAASGVLDVVDAVCLTPPATRDGSWTGWTDAVANVRAALGERGSALQVWISEAGASTADLREKDQLLAIVDAADAGADRAYVLGARDRTPLDGDAQRDDERGLRRADGAPKLAARLWQDGGFASLRRIAGAIPRTSGTDRVTLIVGGAGFIGTNLAHRLLSAGERVLVYDSLARPGVERNARWLKDTHGDRVELEVADVRDAQAVRRAVARADSVFHLAAQVAVTTSVVDPANDFEVNARGTLNVLEAVRAQETPPPLLFTSTNKVYGALEDIEVRVRGGRYEPVPPEVRRRGVSEARPLDFHSPYGCSKGAADQYVLDYARTYGLPTCVFRMSCIYGPHQFGTEDQGWVAHFLIRAIEGRPITIYGNGLQVRDLLFVDDLVEAFVRARARIGELSGRAFNIGGGPTRTTSLMELLELIAELHGRRPEFRLGEWRTGDQRYYVSDTGAFQAAAGWTPATGVREGVRALYEWLRAARGVARRDRALQGGVA